MKIIQWISGCVAMLSVLLLFCIAIIMVFAPTWGLFTAAMACFVSIGICAAVFTLGDIR